MRSFITGMLVGVLGGAVAAYYWGDEKLINPELKRKSRQVVAHTMAAGGDLLNNVGGQASDIIRK
jgi:hypothetical protein